MEFLADTGPIPHVQNVADALCLEKLGARRVVVGAQVEEVSDDLGRKGGGVGSRGRLSRRIAGLHLPVPAHSAHLPFLELVVVSADEARVLSASFPHCRGSVRELSRSLG